MLEVTFLQALRADPRSEQSWIEYAQWLEEQGDLRAELIHILIAVGYPDNLQYYPDHQATIQELREMVDGSWMDEMLELREKLNQRSSHVPSTDEIEQAWQEVQIGLVRNLDSERPKQVGELERALLVSCDCHGEVRFAQCALSSHPVLEWFASRDRWSESQFFPRVLFSDAMQSGLNYSRASVTSTGGELRAELREEDCKWGKVKTFVDDVVGWTCYHPWHEPAAERRQTARLLADRFLDALYPNVSHLRVCSCIGEWEEELCQRMHTWLLVDKETWIVTVIGAQDFGD